LIRGEGSRGWHATGGFHRRRPGSGVAMMGE
jgi:hypothetical protein